MENPIKMDDLGLYHYFRKHPYIGTMIYAFIGVHHFKPFTRRKSLVALQEVPFFSELTVLETVIFAAQLEA